MTKPKKQKPLSPEAAARVWEEERQITEAIAHTRRRLEDVRKVLRLEARARPGELGLLDLERELESRIPQRTNSETFTAQRQAWQTFAKVLDELVQRYEDMRIGWPAVIVQDENQVLPLRDVVKIMEERGWKGSVKAFCGQATVDKAIAACKGTGGRNWYVERLYRLGIERGKIPEPPKAVSAQGLALATFQWR